MDQTIHVCGLQVKTFPQIFSLSVEFELGSVNINLQSLWSFVSIKHITLKTAFLLAITLARQIGEIQSFIHHPEVSYLKVSFNFYIWLEVALPYFYQDLKNSKQQEFHMLDVRGDGINWTLPKHGENTVICLTIPGSKKEKHLEKH